MSCRHTDSVNAASFPFEVLPAAARAALNALIATLLAIALVALASATAVGQQPSDRMFPFPLLLEAVDASDGVSLANTLPRPAGGDTVTRVDGHRFVGATKRRRFWGPNLSFDACFPNREQAEMLADELARLGFNCVRLHHMDGRSIWGKSKNHLDIDPERLERLDWLIYSLKQRGIYSNINLHVSRWFDESDGFLAQDRRPRYDKGLDNFEPRMIELQKDYARDLLTHKNPHTGLTYAEDPAIAMVEINNENSLWNQWSRRDLETLPEPYATEFRRQFAAFLRERYGSTDNLRRAWSEGEVPLGDELLRAGRFSTSLDPNWILEGQQATGSTMEIVPDGSPSGRPCMRLSVSPDPARSWLPQLRYAGLPLTGGKPYTVSFWMRASQDTGAHVNVMMAHDPWRPLGLSTPIDVSTQWQRYDFPFVAESDDDNARVSFTGLQGGTYELANVSLRAGGIVGLKPEERIEDATVGVTRAGISGTTFARRRDTADFLSATEVKYWLGMYQFIKDDLNVQAPVSGTQLSYSPPAVQSQLDYIDAHSYWHHPSFPGRPWDQKNWFVRRRALVDEDTGGTLSGLAMRRLIDKPFTVSEYNHPEPNPFAAEGFPMLAAFAAMQDWDGIFPYTYSHSSYERNEKITGFFDLSGNTPRLVHAPACAAMLLRGDVAPAGALLRVPMTADDQKEKLYETADPWQLVADQFGLDRAWAMRHAVAIDQTKGESASTVRTDIRIETVRDAFDNPPQSLTAEHRIQSDTGQLTWQFGDKPETGLFTVDTPKTKVATGFMDGKTLTLGEVKLTVGETLLGWATVTMTVLTGEGFDQPGRILLALTGKTHNISAEPYLIDTDRLTLSDRWGRAPILCEGIPAEIELPVDPSRVRVYPLDGHGKRREPIEPLPRDGHTLIKVGPQLQTVWYEIEIKP